MYLWLHHTLQAVAPQTKADKKATEQLAGATDPSKPAIALVIGYDRRFGETDGSRSDTIMLVRTQADPPAVSILSFPRDLAVNVTCPGALHRPAEDQCGVRLLRLPRLHVDDQAR